MATNIEMLKEAYDWEQARLQAWKDEMANHPGSTTPHNPATKRFRQIWDSYFDEIMKSNKAVIEICDDAIQNHISVAHAKDWINKEVHDPDLIGLVVTCASNAKRDKINRPQPPTTHATSEYFKALDNAMTLEKEARDFIANYLA